MGRRRAVYRLGDNSMLSAIVVLALGERSEFVSRTILS